MAVAYNNAHLTLPLKGGCHCGDTTYTLDVLPLRVNCCHCTDCQIKSGSAFHINVVIEKTNVRLTSTKQPVTYEEEPGLNISQCEKCSVALWNTYPSLGEEFVFVRAGTLEDARAIVPDVHYFTRSKVDWVAIPEDVKAYRTGTPDGEPGYWTEESKTRIEEVLGKKLL